MRTRIVLTCAGLALGMSACGADATADDSTLRVVASFYPLAYAATEIGGPGVEVENLTPAGSEPHDLEVSPRDVADIQSADLVLLLGHGFQPQLEDAAGSGKHVLRLLDTAGLRRLPNNDPHVWLDPVRYSLIVRRIAAALDAPEQADRLAGRLRSLDRAYAAGLRRCERRELVTSHEAFAYLAGRYGLEEIAITGISPETDPAPRDLERVANRVRETGATTVFFETLVSPRLAETIARETGARTAMLNPIEGLTEDEAAGGADYVSLMRANLAALRKALECR